MVLGFEWRSSSTWRRDDNRREGLVVVMAFSSVCRAELRGLLRLVGRVLRKVEETWRRRSGWVRVSERKVVVWWRISAAVVVADMVVEEEECVEAVVVVVFTSRKCFTCGDGQRRNWVNCFVWWCQVDMWDGL